MMSVRIRCPSYIADSFVRISAVVV